MMYSCLRLLRKGGTYLKASGVAFLRAVAHLLKRSQTTPSKVSILSVRNVLRTTWVGKFALLTLLFLPSIAWATPVYQTSGSGGVAGGTSMTATVFVPSALSNSLLVVVCASEASKAPAFAQDGSTFLATSTQFVGSTLNIGYWVEPAPASGSHTIKCGGYASSSFADIVGEVFSGAAQTGFPDGHAEKTLSSGATSASQAITTVANNALVIDFGAGTGNTSVLVPGAGQTTISYAGSSTSTAEYWTTYIAKATAGSITTTDSWTSSCGSSCSYVDFSIAPAVAVSAAPFNPFIMLFGNW